MDTCSLCKILPRLTSNHSRHCTLPKLLKPLDNCLFRTAL